MKRLYVLSGLIAFTCLIGIYCSKKSSDPEPPPASSNAPQIDSLSGPHAWPDEQLTIYGLRFGDTQDSTRHVVIWPDTVDVISWSDTLIETDIPDNLGVTHVSVAADGDTSNAMPFSVFGITSVEPGFAFFGDTIQIHGLGFGGSQDSNMVMIGGVPAHVVSWYYTLIVAIVPEGAGSGEVEVNAGGHSSTWQHLAIIGLAFISGIEPDWGTYGTTTIITGQDFGEVGGEVRFNGTIASVHSWSDTVIETEFPFGCESGVVDVAVRGLTSIGHPFSVFGITDIDHSYLMAGDTIGIVGTGFRQTQDLSHVEIDGQQASAISWSDNSIYVIVPDSLTDGVVSVFIDGMQSNSINIDVDYRPCISSVEPNRVTFGSVLVVRGLHLAKSNYLTSLYIGDFDVPVSYKSDTLVTCIVPFGSTSGDVTVYVGSIRSSNKKPVSVVGIEWIHPGSVQFGDTIQIVGTGLGSEQGSNYVILDDLVLPVLSWSDELVSCLVPDGAVSGALKVVVDGLNTNSEYLFVEADQDVLSLLTETNYIEVRFEAIVEIDTGGTKEFELTLFAGPRPGWWPDGTLSWSSESFHALYDWNPQSQMDGSVSLDGTVIDSSRCYYRWELYDQGPGCESYELLECSFSFKNLPLRYFCLEDSTVFLFEVSGPLAANHLEDLAVHYLDEGWHYSDSGELQPWNYDWYSNSVNWDHPNYRPRISAYFTVRPED